MGLDNEEAVRRFKEFLIRTDYEKRLRESVNKGSRSFLVSLSDLEKYDPDLADTIILRPIEIIEELEAVVSGMDLSTKERVYVRIYDMWSDFDVKLKDLRTKHLGKLVQVEGLIRQASEVRPEVLEITFECLDCGNKISVLQTEHGIKKPTRCICGKSVFKEVDKAFRDSQGLKLEESPERLVGGEQPSRVDVILHDDLVEPTLRERLTPGNRVKVTGVLKEKPNILRTGARSKIFEIYLHAIYIENTVQEFEKLELTKEDEDAIRQLASDPKIKEKIVASIAPSIYGNERIKEAIALQLFGGVSKIRQDKMRTRGEIHVFLVGDPGSGKSQLLKYVSMLSPKSMYVSGKGATGAGLTAAVVKDEFLGGWALEAGAVVLCNRGLCAIDEIDKMAEDDRTSMHEIMEQGTVSIAKANIHANLRAETSILAAANPKYSRFDPHKEMIDQIDMPETLLSRFDLIFVLRDVPDREKDESLADHILMLHKQPKSHLKAAIDSTLMRKYIAYAKRTFEQTHLTSEAVAEIKSFYVGLRTKHLGEREELQSVPITARQLEAMVRLAEANARLRLSDTVTAEDALKAIDLMKYCLYQIGFDPETGKLDIARLEGSVSTAKRSKINTFEQALKEIEKDGSLPFKQVDLVAKAVELGMSQEDAEGIMDKLIKQGTLYCPRPGLVQRVG